MPAKKKYRYITRHVHAGPGGKEIWKRFRVPIGMTDSEFTRMYNRKLQAARNPIPSRWADAKVRRKGSDVQVLVMV